MTADEFSAWLRGYMCTRGSLNSHDLEVIKKKSFEIDFIDPSDRQAVLLAEVKDIITKNDFSGVSWYIVSSKRHGTPYQLAARTFNYEVEWDFYKYLTKPEAQYLIESISELYPRHNIAKDFK